MIIDFHTHVFPERIAAATVERLSLGGKVPYYSDGTTEGLLEKMADAGIDISVNLPVLTKPSQFESVTAFAKALNEREYENERIISFGGIHPDEENVEERLTHLKKQGFLGIKLHPDYQHTFFDDEKFVRILASAKKLDLITLTHTGYDPAYEGEEMKCTPKRILNLLDKIGGYDKLILAHLGCNMLFDDVYATLAGENVYFDTSYILHDASEEIFKKILEKHGEDRTLFASDSPWRDAKCEVAVVKGYNLGKDTEEKIFSGNAKKLLGI